MGEYDCIITNWFDDTLHIGLMVHLLIWKNCVEVYHKFIAI